MHHCNVVCVIDDNELLANVLYGSPQVRKFRILWCQLARELR